jgi:hypothetical protein
VADSPSRAALLFALPASLPTRSPLSRCPLSVECPPPFAGSPARHVGALAKMEISEGGRPPHWALDVGC